jgi:hypothetical protein
MTDPTHGRVGELADPASEPAEHSTTSLTQIGQAERR